MDQKKKDVLFFSMFPLFFILAKKYFYICLDNLIMFYSYKFYDISPFVPLSMF
jgi:hypothetical protein